MIESLATWWGGQTLPLLEWGACGLSFAYVFLAARNTPWCWPFAFIGSCVWAYQVWTAYDLWFDTLLNIFYAVMALVGWAKWLERDEPSVEILPVTRMSLGEHARVIGLGTVLSVGFAVWAQRYTNAALAGPDAVTTVFSVLGTFLLIGRRLENWLYFVVIDLAYVWIYLERGSVVFAVTFAIYAGMAVYGYSAWRRGLLMRVDGTASSSAV